MAPIYLDPLNNGRDTPPTGQRGAGIAVHRRLRVPGSRSLARDRARGRVRLVDVVRGDRAPRPRDRRRDAKLMLDATISPTRCPRGRQSVRRTPPRRCCRTSGSPPGTVYDNEDTVRDPQLRARGASVEIDHPDLGVIEYYQSAHRMTKTPGFVRRRGPRLGEHTCEVLQEWLSLDAHEISVLEAADAVWQAPSDVPVRSAVMSPSIRRSTRGEVSHRHRRGGIRRRHQHRRGRAAHGRPGLRPPRRVGTGRRPARPHGTRQFGGADRRSHRRVRGGRGLHVDGTFERRGEDKFEETVELFRNHPGARLEPGPRSAAAGNEKVEALVAAVPGLRLTARHRPRGDVGRRSRSPVAPRRPRAAAPGGGGPPAAPPRRGR